MIPFGHHQTSRCLVALFGAMILSVAVVQPVDAQIRPVAGELAEAREAIESGRYLDALAALTEAITGAPDDPAAYGERAQLLASLGHTEMASADYRTAALIRSGDAGLLANLCWTLALANHDLDGALSACNAAVRLGANNPDALSKRGYVQLRRGEYASAESDYLAALQLTPAAPNEMFGHGLALIHLGRDQEGRDEIASATLDSASLVLDWEGRGFGSRGQIKPGRTETKANEPVLSVSDRKVFLNRGEAYATLPGGCGWIEPVQEGARRAPTTAWSGACRFGLIHGAGTIEAGGPLVRFAYGRRITPDAAGAALEQKVTAAYRPAEAAIQP